MVEIFHKKFEGKKNTPARNKITVLSKRKVEIPQSLREQLRKNW